MRFLSGEEEKSALEYLLKAAEVALNSTCRDSRCGSVVVQNNEIIGVGFNSPPLDDESQRRCHLPKSSYNEKVTDKTCCVHAEQRAIIDALRTNPEKLAGSKLYFIRLNSDGTIAKAGKPYCTICSKMALDTGVAEFILWHKEGICAYNTHEYNEISFQYR